jgi:hypothetical protein
MAPTYSSGTMPEPPLHDDRLDARAPGEATARSCAAAQRRVCATFLDVEARILAPQATGPTPGTGTTAAACSLDLRPIGMLLAASKRSTALSRSGSSAAVLAAMPGPKATGICLWSSPDDTRDEELDLLFLWRLKRGSDVRVDVIACRASEFREACDTVNTLSYAVATEGVRIWTPTAEPAAGAEPGQTGCAW